MRMIALLALMLTAPAFSQGTVNLRQDVGFGWEYVNINDGFLAGYDSIVAITPPEGCSVEITGADYFIDGAYQPLTYTTGSVPGAWTRFAQFIPPIGATEVVIYYKVTCGGVTTTHMVVVPVY